MTSITINNVSIRPLANMWGRHKKTQKLDKKKKRNLKIVIRDCFDAQLRRRQFDFRKTGVLENLPGHVSPQNEV